MGSAPDVRREKVDELKHALQYGYYPTSAQQIADAMLRHLDRGLLERVAGTSQRKCVEGLE